MTDTSPTPNSLSEIEDVFEDDSVLYVEVETRIIFEAKLFPDFVLVRPVSPQLYHQIRKVTMLDFGKEFEDFLGDHKAVRGFLNGTVESELETWVKD